MMDTLYLREAARRDLISVLQSVSRTKSFDLVIDPDLIPLLQLIAGFQFLREHGVDSILKFESQCRTGNERRIYMIQPEIWKTKMVADHINADKNKEHRTLHSVTVVMVPRKLYPCEEILEYEGVYGDVSIRAYDHGFVPLENNILSLEIPQFNRDFFLHRDQSWIQLVASSLHRIENKLGIIPNVYCLGNAAVCVQELMKNIYDKLKENGERIRSSEIGSLILVDRDVDYVSALLTQLTYAGQFDEVFGIRSGNVVYDTKAKSGKMEQVKLALSDDDGVYSPIRDVHIVRAFDVLSSRTKELVQRSKERQEMTTVNEMKQFVKNKLRDQQLEHKLVSQHVGACEAISKSNVVNKVQQRLTIEKNIVEGTGYKDTVTYLEDGIILQKPMVNILRLCCLFSLTHGGLPAKDYYSLRTKFLQSYGYEHLVTFHNLQKLGLFVQQENIASAPLPAKIVEKMASAGISHAPGSLFGKNDWKMIGKKFNLIPKHSDDYDMKCPLDLSFVFGSVYIPLTCQLALQALNKEKWGDLCKTFSCPSAYEVKASSARGRAGSDLVSFRPPSQVMIVFLGGLTYAEVAAFRMLERTHNCSYILATTSLINGNKIMNDALFNKTK